VHSAFARLFVVCVVLACSQASADYNSRGFDLVPLKASPAFNSGVGLEGATVSPRKSYRFSALLDSNFGILALKLGDEKLGDLVPFRSDLHFLFAYQVSQRLELGLDLPLTVFQVGNFDLFTNRFAQQGVSAVGLGSVRLLPRLSLLDPSRFPIGLAGVFEIRLPSPSGFSFLGDSGFVFAPRVAVERSFGRVRLLGTLGYRLRPVTAQYLNLYVGNEFTSGVGAIVSLPDWKRFKDIKLVSEMHLSTPTEAPFNFGQADSLKTPWELLLGVRTKVYGNWVAELTLGRGWGSRAVMDVKVSAFF